MVNISSTLAMMPAHVQGMLTVTIQVRHTCIITVSMSVAWHLHVSHILLMNESKKNLKYLDFISQSRAMQRIYCMYI